VIKRQRDENNVVRRLLWPAVLVACSAGCMSSSDPAASPVFVPVRTMQTRRTEPHEVLVALPNRGLASVQLHYFCWSGRVAFTRMAVVNHHPDRATVDALRAKVYVDDRDPLHVNAFDRFKPDEDPLDKRLLKPYPADARAEWVIFKMRFLAPDDVRGPMIVLPYEVYGEKGFVKIPYETLWNVNG
jgi:hypothetical protein